MTKVVSPDGSYVGIGPVENLPLHMVVVGTSAEYDMVPFGNRRLNAEGPTCEAMTCDLTNINCLNVLKIRISGISLNIIQAKVIIILFTLTGANYTS
jgi:hypothetical protein